MILRPYQNEGVATAMTMLLAGQSCLGVAATGLGKTICFAEVARRWPSEKGRVLVMAHTEELVDQSIDKMHRVIGERPAKEMNIHQSNEHPTRRRKVVVASVQSLNSGERLKKFENIGLIIVDEAHRGVAPMYRKVYDHFAKVPRLGVTATPDRLDEEALGQVFDEVAFNFDLNWAVVNRWLVPIVARTIKCEGLDLSKCRVTGGDLNGADLMDAMDEEAVIQQMAHGIVEHAGNRKTLVFMPGGFKDVAGNEVRVSQLMYDVLNRRKTGSAEWVMGHHPREQRTRTIQDFREGRFQFLVNVDVLTEGFDDPGIQCVAMCRPTMSRAKYSQMLGRGTRALPGIIDHLGGATVEERGAAIKASAKPYVEVFDFVGLSGRHKLVTATDILGGKHSEKAVSRVREKSDSEGAVDVIEALDDAEVQIELEKRKQIIADAQKFHTRVIDPFDVLCIEPQREYGWDRAKRPSAKMVNFAKSLGMDVSGMSFGKVRQLLGEAVKRRNTGKASFDQAKRLLEKGLDPTVNAATAARLLGDPSAERIARLQERYKAMVGGQA